MKSFASVRSYYQLLIINFIIFVITKFSVIVDSRHMIVQELPAVS